MCWAAAAGDVDMMTRLLRDHGADVRAGDYDKRTPLHIAASDGREAAVEWLLQHGARPDVLDRWGRSPLDCARDGLNTRVRQLIERAHGALSSAEAAAAANAPMTASGMRRVQSHHDLPALFRAVQDGDTEKVKRIWLGGLELNSTDEQGRTSLHVAVENAQVGVVELLLSADVDTNVLDANGHTPLSVALERRLYGIADMLRAHQKTKAGVALQTRRDDDPRVGARAFAAVKRGDLEELKTLVPDLVHPDVQDYDLRTLLHIASAEGHLAITQYLVACGANVNLLDRWGTSPLADAVDFAHNDVARFLVVNHASESGHRAALEIDQIDSLTLTTALEFALRVVTRQRWVLGQVFCPMQDETGACVLVAHKSAAPPTSSTFINAFASPLNDPIQLFRKAGSVMMIDPGQGHTGRVFSGQHPEWLNLHTVQQSHLFLLPHARRAGLQTMVSVPMMYKMTSVAVLSWYSDELLAEDPDEIQRIQRLLRSVVILATLRQELQAMEAAPANAMQVSRFQYCQSLDNAITANGELLTASLDQQDGDVLPLALDWRLFGFVDRLATSMSSEDHGAVVSLLRSLVSMLRNGFFSCVFDETTQEERDEPQDIILTRCAGQITSRWTLLVHMRYYILYLHAVSPTEGTIFMDVDRLVPTINRYFAGEDVTMEQSRVAKRDDAVQQAPPEVSPPKGDGPVEKECVLCKFKVPGKEAIVSAVKHHSTAHMSTIVSTGHIHPGKAPIAPTAPKKPVFTSTSPYAAGEAYFGAEGNPRSPVLREIQQLLGKMEAEYDTFDRKSELDAVAWDGAKSSMFTSSDLYDAIGAAHDPPTPRRPGAAADPRKRVLDVINEIMDDTSALISFDQLMRLHATLLPEQSEHAGLLRTSAAVGYASPRIYRVFLPAGEISNALRDLIATINDTSRWATRPLLCAYYAFAVLVFFIHPFHDGNGRCARLLGNVISKKLGFPGIFRAADKTIQLTEFLHKAVVTMEIILNSRRQSRQSRVLSTRKENTSMWF
ncbi:hypothetical protein P43SY_001544 [Pythium insidiosum]|uniref:Fido domain-containing protein n=1 Tax=Pythium insidiosum TaxID=114742 RepID=A0AAD5LAT6_PYTIN|nr:hypothetical protein P43SY_001544 [Pythium insidiosum]